MSEAPLAERSAFAALVTACALFVAVAGVSIAVVGRESTTHDTTLVSALIGDDGSYGLPTSGTSHAATGEVDSGMVNP